MVTRFKYLNTHYQLLLTILTWLSLILISFKLNFIILIIFIILALLLSLLVFPKISIIYAKFILCDKYFIYHHLNKEYLFNYEEVISLTRNKDIYKISLINNRSLKFISVDVSLITSLRLLAKKGQLTTNIF